VSTGDAAALPAPSDDVDDLLKQFVHDPWATLTLRQALDAAVQNFYQFTLVLIRMSGLLAIGPFFGQPIVPANLRVLLVLVLSLLITPSLLQHSAVGFQRLDTNVDGVLKRDELPAGLHDRFDRVASARADAGRAGITLTEFAFAPNVPSSIFDYAWIALGEFSLGLVLGLGVLVILSGLQLAGELIDQQTGIALGEVFNPGLDTTSSISGETLLLLGSTVLLLTEPLNGHLLMLSALVETFQTLPVGDAWVAAPAIEVLSSVVHQSLVLAVQVAAPVLATISLISLTMGFLGHTVPQINVLVVGFPVRALINTFVLALTLSGAGRLMVVAVPQVIDELRSALSSLP
jgi:flagellar biosynthetic protein FliR